MSEILVANGVLVNNPYRVLRKWSSYSMYVSFIFYCFVLLQPGYDDYYFITLLMIPIIPYLCLMFAIKYNNVVILFIYALLQCIMLTFNISMMLQLGKKSKYYLDSCRACNFSQYVKEYCFVNNTEFITGDLMDEIDEMNLGDIDVLSYEKCSDISINTFIYYVLYLSMIFMNYMTISSWRKIHNSVVIKTVVVETGDIDVIDMENDDAFHVRHVTEQVVSHYGESVGIDVPNCSGEIVESSEYEESIIQEDRV